MSRVAIDTSLELSGLFYSEPERWRPAPNWVLLRWRMLCHRFSERRILARYRAEAQVIDDFSAWACRLSNSEVDGWIVRLSQLARCNKLIDRERPILLQGLAVLREVCAQQLGERPYDVQLMCVLAMLDCNLVQLAPGEGKTLSLGVVAVVFAWVGRPCHVVTANEYLAQRDAELMRPLFSKCRLSVRSLDSEDSGESEDTPYRADIVYGTSKQFLAEYLKDSLLLGDTEVNCLGLTVHFLQGVGEQQLKMRGLHSVIIDEADSILIDEAVTPLIISGPDANVNLHLGILAAKAIVDHLVADEDYRLNLALGDVGYTRKGERKLDQHLDSLPPLWQHPDRRREILKQAIQARDVFLQDHHYVVDDDKIVIVDEATGRTMPGRTWSNGLHQAIEARAGVTMSDPNKIMARMSFQNFFKLYRRISGASGTLQDIDREIFYNYGIHTLRVPPRLPDQRQIHRFQAFSTEQAKLEHVVDVIRRFNTQKVPVLVGTRSVEDSERIAEKLRRSDIICHILNAKNNQEEAGIVAAAGLPCAVTVATNMAGRGTDIKVADDVIAEGGLRVIMLEPHESSRIDWQLFGRTGRQGKAGEVLPMASASDDLFRKHLPSFIKPVLKVVRQTRYQNTLMTFLVKAAQQHAQRKAFRSRQRLNKNDARSKKMISFVKSKN